MWAWCILTGLCWYPRLGWETSLFPHVNSGKSDVSQPNRGYQNRPVRQTSWIKRPPNVVMRIFGVGGAAQVSSSSSDHGSKLWDPSRNQHRVDSKKGFRIKIRPNKCHI
ncbi:hypothetical protein AVEN_172423-1 [Araneus ventricosus]|uniref:Secreted protein n=1 Tax=Araneus ventricosus TaxID=182803 RepID=A0A4Y2LLL8_ARAVE|nr:hypothetical protein AVEN_172423-1 [Araneus ventricosus]